MSDCPDCGSCPASFCLLESLDEPLPPTAADPLRAFPREPGPGEGCVYFVGPVPLTPESLVKIGRSVRVRERVRELRIGSPVPLRAYLLMPVTSDVLAEVKLHARFAHRRERGEWFRADGEVLEFIARMRALGFPDGPEAGIDFR